MPGPLKNYINVLATGHWLRNIVTELGAPIEGIDAQPVPEAFPNPERIIKGITFLSTQLLLTSLNPQGLNVGGLANGVWNPLSLAASIPLVGGFDPTNITMAAAFGGKYQDRVRSLASDGLDRLTQLRDGYHVESSPIHRASKLLPPIGGIGFVGDTTGPNQQSIDQPLPGALATIALTLENNSATDTIALQGTHTNIHGAQNPYDLGSARSPQEDLLRDSRRGLDPGQEKISSLFDARAFSGGPPGGPGSGLASQVATWVVKPSLTAGISNTFNGDAPGLNAAVVPAGFPGENEDGLVEDNPLDDDSTYMPFMFEDLRDPTDEKKFLYFRAFLKGDINETFTPDWTEQRYYGRVDSVPIYKGTLRTLNFSFDVAAFTPADLPLIWKKLDKLQSLVYPSYDLRGFMSAGPLIRLRIGDLFAGAGKRGLPGYITGMDWSYPDGIWEVDTNFKVPRLITVAISYTVIHDGNPGIYRKESYTLSPNGDDVNGEKEAQVFGAGKFSAEAGGSESADTQVKVSREEIRNIFKTVRGN